MKTQLLFILLIAIIGNVSGQEAGDIDTTFRISNNGAINGEVYKLIVQPDEKILAYGTFTRIGNRSTPYLLRLFPTGEIDTSFQSPFYEGQLRFSNNPIIRQANGIQLRPDGKILLCGRFDSVGNSRVKNLSVLHPDGRVDTTFAPFRNSSESIYNVEYPLTAFQASSGKILYSFKNSFWGSGLVSVKSDGSIDSTFLLNQSSQNIWNFTGLKNGKLFVHLYDPCDVCPADGGPRYSGRFLKIEANQFQIASGFAEEFGFVAGCWLEENNESGNLYSSYITFGIPTNFAFSRFTRADSTTQSYGNIMVSYQAELMDFNELITVSPASWDLEGPSRIDKLIYPDSIPETVLLGNANATVQSIVRNSANQVYLVGGFSTWNGQPCSQIIRLHNKQTILRNKPRITKSPLFPNPSASRNCTIQNLPAGSLISVFNQQGQTVPGQLSTEPNQFSTISLSENQPAGLYFVRVTTAGSTTLYHWVVLPE
jgi:hypothetical protein